MTYRQPTDSTTVDAQARFVDDLHPVRLTLARHFPRRDSGDRSARPTSRRRPVSRSDLRERWLGGLPASGGRPAEDASGAAGPGAVGPATNHLIRDERGRLNQAAHAVVFDHALMVGTSITPRLLPTQLEHRPAGQRSNRGGHQQSANHADRGDQQDRLALLPQRCGDPGENDQSNRPRGCGREDPPTRTVDPSAQHQPLRGADGAEQHHPQYESKGNERSVGRSKSRPSVSIGVRPTIQAIAAPTAVAPTHRAWFTSGNAVRRTWAWARPRRAPSTAPAATKIGADSPAAIVAVAAPTAAGTLKPANSPSVTHPVHARHSALSVG